MGFEDLEYKLKKFFHQEELTVDNSQKARIKELVWRKFSAKKLSFWQKLLFVGNSKYALSGVLFFLLIVAVPIINNQIYAGEISRESGLVEIIRNGKHIILDGKSRLRVGDEIVVNGHANAKLTLKNNFKSEVLSNTKIKIDGRNSVFLIHGQLNNDLKSGKIITNKGEILAREPSSFFVDVSNSGETRVTPRKNKVAVRNWQGEEIKLSAGEELRLSSDTKFTSQLLPRDLNLSNAQIKAIRAKLFITRTKAVNYIEKVIDGNKKEAQREKLSAEKTFKSIVQILKTSRDLKTMWPRENIEMVEIDDIYARVAKKTNNKNLLTEIKSVAKLLKIIREQDKFDLELLDTGVKSFDRYVLVSRLFSKDNSETFELGNILRHQYVNAFVAKILNEELKIDQISVLNSEVRKLPRTTMAKFFLKKVGEMLTPDLQKLLAEKVESEF